MIRRGKGDRDDARFEALYRKFYARVYRYFLRCRVSDAEAQDLAQATFARIYEHFDQYRGEAEWSFIQTAARNELLNWIRAGRTAKRNADVRSLDDGLTKEEPRIEDGPDLAERQQLQMRKARLWAAIAELPEGQRQCIELWLGDAKYEGIAKTLGITLDAVKSRLRDAKRSLRSTLGESLPEDDE
jgi:RNA polymerase sigma-70 factor (ECF subfamily)